MISHPSQRIGVFVDVQNMYYSSRNLYNSHTNFEEILNTAVQDRQLIHAFAYTIKIDSSDEQKFFDALTNRGFQVKQKELQTYLNGNKKGDWDVGITVDAIIMAPKLDVVSLVTGDGDFIPLVRHLHNLGCMVEVLSFRNTTSTKLIEECDYFINLEHDEAKYLIERPEKTDTSTDH